MSFEEELGPRPTPSFPPKSDPTPTPAANYIKIVNSSDHSLIGRFAVAGNNLTFTTRKAAASTFAVVDDPRFPGSTDHVLKVLGTKKFAFGDPNDVFAGNILNPTQTHAWPVVFEKKAAVEQDRFVTPMVQKVKNGRRLNLQMQFDVPRGGQVTAAIPQVCGTEPATLVLADGYLPQCQNVTLGYVKK